MYIDINCDLGEIVSEGNEGSDEKIMPFISSANIACGLHAGDPLTIMKTIRTAMIYGAGIGAHPGYPDREGFGRRPFMVSHEELRALILYQAGALKGMAEAAGARMQHVKPHGALYNAAAKDYDMALVIAQAVKDLDSTLTLVGLSGSQLIRAAREKGLASASEVFADRAYNDDGTLVPRDMPGAVLNDTEAVIERTIRMINEKVVETVNGKIIPIEADTVCIHGDNEMAAVFVSSLAEALRKRGIELKYFAKQ
ncbi:MAG: LamB/YcsF family protein [Bacteroidales bacterium]|nr:LamB/YcsF family protein [Bacteroidales bacterium]